MYSWSVSGLRNPMSTRPDTICLTGDAEGRFIQMIAERSSDTYFIIWHSSPELAPKNSDFAANLKYALRFASASTLFPVEQYFAALDAAGVSPLQAEVEAGEIVPVLNNIVRILRAVPPFSSSDVQIRTWRSALHAAVRELDELNYV